MNIPRNSTNRIAKKTPRHQASSISTRSKSRNRAFFARSLTTLSLCLGIFSANIGSAPIALGQVDEDSKTLMVVIYGDGGEDFANKHYFAQRLRADRSVRVLAVETCFKCLVNKKNESIKRALGEVGGHSFDKIEVFYYGHSGRPGQDTKLASMLDPMLEHLSDNGTLILTDYGCNTGDANDMITQVTGSVPGLIFVKEWSGLAGHCPAAFYATELSRKLKPGQRAEMTVNQNKIMGVLIDNYNPHLQVDFDYMLKLQQQFNALSYTITVTNHNITAEPVNVLGSMPKDFYPKRVPRPDEGSTGRALGLNPGPF